MARWQEFRECIPKESLSKTHPCFRRRKNLGIPADLVDYHGRPIRGQSTLTDPREAIAENYRTGMDAVRSSSITVRENQDVVVANGAGSPIPLARPYGIRPGYYRRLYRLNCCILIHEGLSH